MIRLKRRGVNSRWGNPLTFSRDGKRITTRHGKEIDTPQREPGAEATAYVVYLYCGICIGLWPVSWEQNGGMFTRSLHTHNIIECNNRSEKLFLIVYRLDFSGD